MKVRVKERREGEMDVEREHMNEQHTAYREVHIIMEGNNNLTSQIHDVTLMCVHVYLSVG